MIFLNVVKYTCIMDEKHIPRYKLHMNIGHHHNSCIDLKAQLM